MIANKILFPEYLDWHQHSFAAWLSQKRDLSNLRLFMRSIYDLSNFEKCNTTLLSGEDFENFLIDTHLALEFESLAISCGYSEIQWIIVKRNPLEYLLSIYSEKSAYKLVLDLGVISNSIIEYGFFCASSPLYNYKFVFDVIKFSELFKKSVNPNIKIIDFNLFIKDFPGKIIINQLVNDKSLEIFREEAKSIGIKRKRVSKEKIEFRYVANFLGMNPSKEFYESNKKIVDSLASHRLQRNEALLIEIKAKFKERFC